MASKEEKLTMPGGRSLLATDGRILSATDQILSAADAKIAAKIIVSYKIRNMMYEFGNPVNEKGDKDDWRRNLLCPHFNAEHTTSNSVENLNRLLTDRNCGVSTSGFDSAQEKRQILIKALGAEMLSKEEKEHSYIREWLIKQYVRYLTDPVFAQKVDAYENTDRSQADIDFDKQEARQAFTLDASQGLEEENKPYFEVFRLNMKTKSKDPNKTKESEQFEMSANSIERYESHSIHAAFAFRPNAQYGMRAITMYPAGTSLEDIQNGHAVLTKPTAMILDPADGKEKSCKDYIREKVVQTEAYQHTTAAGKTEIDFITYVNDKRLSAPGLITHTAYCKPRDARDGRNAFSPRLSVYTTMHKPGGTPEYFRIDIFDDLTRNEKTSLMKMGGQAMQYAHTLDASQKKLADLYNDACASNPSNKERALDLLNDAYIIRLDKPSDKEPWGVYSKDNVKSNKMPYRTFKKKYGSAYTNFQRMPYQQNSIDEVLTGVCEYVLEQKDKIAPEYYHKDAKSVSKELIQGTSEKGGIRLELQNLFDRSQNINIGRVSKAEDRLRNSLPFDSEDQPDTIDCTK